MSGHMKKLLRSEDGATAIEYGLIAALIAVAIIVGATALGSSLNSIFDSVSTTVDDASPSP